VDSDGDGWEDLEDCAPGNAAVHPGRADALCDHLDEDCDGVVDEDAETSPWYADLDGDGYGDPAVTVESCDEPERYVATASKAGRRGKIYVDWLRNARGATAVAPYSPRARSGAPVATPLRWEELGRIEHPGAYRIGNLRRRLASLAADPWEEYDEARASPTPAVEALVEASPPKRRRPRAGSRSGT